MIRYRDILKEAWQTTIHNRWLWVLGLFTAVLTNVNIHNQIFSSFDGGGWNRIINYLYSVWQKLINYIDFIGKNPLYSLALILVIVIVIALLFLAISSQILLVERIQLKIKSNRKKTIAVPECSFCQQIKANWPKFWSTALMVVIIKSLLLICLLVSSLSMTAIYLIDQPIISTFFLHIFLILFFLAIVWLLAVWGRYWLLLFLSEKNSCLIKSAQQAWQMVSKNILTSLEIFTLTVTITFSAYLLWVFSIYVLAIPFSLLTMLVVQYLKVSELVMLILAQIIVITSLIILVSVTTVFEHSLWLSFMDKLSNKGVVSKITHLFARK